MRHTLSDQEVVFFSQMIYRINSAKDYHAVAHTALQQLHSIIPCNKGILFLIRERDGALYYEDPVALNTPGNSFDETVFMKGSYRSGWLMATSSPWSSTFRQTDIRDESTFREGRLYKDIYEPQNIYYGLHSILVHEDRKIAQLGLFRSMAEKDFSERDVFVLNTLMPHLERKLNDLVSEPRPVCISEVGRESRWEQQEEFQFYMMQEYGITKREMEVGTLMCAGKSNQEIATALFISKSTLDKHLYNLYRKTGVKSRTQLAYFFNAQYGGSAWRENG